MAGSGIVLPLAASLGLLALQGGCAGAGGRHPDASLPPSTVVRLQVEALAEASASDGIAVAFRFASPANKEATGPLERFTGIVQAPSYSPLLDHLDAAYGPLHVEGRFAAQVVEILARDGSRHTYLFELTRQRGGPFDGCWMTDSVRLLSTEGETGTAL